jgi:hypothetical protein
VDRLLDRWQASQARNTDASKDVPDRATIYRWLNGAFPRTRDDLLRLCGFLDVDPFCMLTLPATDEAAAVRRLHSAFWLNRWEPPALSFFAEFFGHQHYWPPSQLAKQYYGRDWHTEEFGHDPEIRANYYAQIELVRLAVPDSGTPQVFHFAYQQPGLFGQRWIQYGFVERQGLLVRLLNITGQVEHYRAESGDRPSVVETWFGPSLANFRIASLHPFSMRFKDAQEPTDLRVRFSG